MFFRCFLRLVFALVLVSTVTFAAKKKKRDFDARSSRTFLTFIDEHFPDGLRAEILKHGSKTHELIGPEVSDILNMMGSFFSNPKYLEQMGLITRISFLAAIADCLAFLPEPEASKIRTRLRNDVESWWKFLSQHWDILVEARKTGHGFDRNTSQQIVYYWFASLTLFIEDNDRGRESSVPAEVLDGTVTIAADDFREFPEEIRALLLVHFVNKSVTAITLSEQMGINQKLIAGVQKGLQSSRHEILNLTVDAIRRKDIEQLKKLWPSKSCEAPLGRKKRRR